MNRATYNGFIKRAQEAGLTQKQANQMFKEATGMDPSQLPMDPSMQGGAPAQAQPQPPQHHGHEHHGGGGQPPQGGGAPPDASGGLGVPPDIEQLIQQLPPEVLQQLVQEIEAELSHGGGGQPQ